MEQTEIHRHTIAVLVDNESGVLARVIGLFAGRGYNIESLTVAKVDDDENLSRITIVTTGTQMVIAQIKAQLERLVPVHKIADLTLEGPSVEREMALVKVECKGDKRVEAMRVADIFRARTVDVSEDSLIFEVTGARGKVKAFIAQYETLGRTEVCRTGVVAVKRGKDTI